MAESVALQPSIPGPVPAVPPGWGGPAHASAEGAAGAGPLAEGGLAPAAGPGGKTPPAVATLLVEDDAGLRALLASVLEERGHAVTACATGEEGWDRYRERRGAGRHGHGYGYALAVLDRRLPGLDGLELCRRIRALPGGDRTVVLVLTGETGPHHLAETLDAGANDYLPKGGSFDLDVFRVRLAVAEGHARALAERGRAEARLRLLADAAGAFAAGGLDLSATLESVAGLIAAHVGDACAIRLLAEDGRTLVPWAVSHRDEGARAALRELADVPIPAGAGLSGRALATGAPVLRSPLAEGDLAEPLRRWFRRYAELVGRPHGGAVVPMRAHGRAVGTIMAVRGEPSPRFVADDLVLLQDLADRAAAAIANAQHHRRAEAELAERARAEEALRRSEARFRSLVQHAADVISVLGADGRLAWVSPAAAQVLGEDPMAADAGDGFARVHPDDRARVRPVFADLLAHPGEQRTWEARLRHRDGSWRHLEILATNLLEDPDVGGVVINARDISESKAVEEQLLRQALHDPLTGLPNRALFLDRLGHALEGARRRGERVGVLTLDLDRFKTVNESLGHAAGDRLLEAVGTRLAGARPGDTVARFGGDEFGVLVEGVTEAGAVESAAAALHEALRPPFVVGGEARRVRASIGVALVEEAGPGPLPGELLRHAEVALHRAKALGRDRSAVYEPGRDRGAAERLDLETDLHWAVERDQLRLHYQPEVDLASGRVVGLEALVRWAHPRRGMVPPGDFIPLAEETGLIVPIGQWVLAEACRQVRRWQAGGLRGAGHLRGVNVNLSARQLAQPGFAGWVARTLEETGLDPAALKLEITERVLVEDDAAVAGALAALRALGVRLAIDDFGTGYSSFGYLHRLRGVDTIKIDRSWVGGLDVTSAVGEVAGLAMGFPGVEGSPAGAAGPADRLRVVVRAVVSLAHDLGMDVTAEGIETEAQLASVRAIACDTGQGYRFARPLPPPDLEAFLAAGA